MAKTSKPPFIQDTKLSKEHRKLFFKYLYRYYGDRRFMSLYLQEDLWCNAQEELKDDPNFGSELWVIRKALSTIFDMSTNTDDEQAFLFFHHTYWNRFVENYLLPKVRRNKGKFPEMNKTEAIQEFIARGFVHKDEYPENLLDGNYYILCNIAPLVYPKKFEFQSKALEVLDKIGIPGHNGVTRPKN